MPDIALLRQYQSLPLQAKIAMSQQRIREWYVHFDGNVYVSFSGGKDSTVLAHLVHEYYPDVPLVFVNTGLEYPEIQAFARRMGAVFVRPKMSFREVLTKFGYPIISKEVSQNINESRKIGDKNLKQKKKLLGVLTYECDGDQRISPYNCSKWLLLAQEAQFKISKLCCAKMKKAPVHEYEKQNGVVPYVGTLTEQSLLRQSAWIKHGCNSFDGKQTSQPMSFWTEQDVLHYIYDNMIEIAPVYGDVVAEDEAGFMYEPMVGSELCKLKCSGCQRTGCVFCGFGFHLEKGETRFQRLAKTHPRQYEYCLGGGEWADNPDYDATAPEYSGDWKNWNPKKIWVPNDKGLGMKKVFDDVNDLYGKGTMRYE